MDLRCIYHNPEGGGHTKLYLDYENALLTHWRCPVEDCLVQVVVVNE